MTGSVLVWISSRQMPLILHICRIFVKEYGYAPSNHGVKSWSSRWSVAPRLQAEIGLHESRKDDLWVFATWDPSAVCEHTPSWCIALLNQLHPDVSWFSRARGTNKWEQCCSIDIPYLQTQHGPSALWSVYIFAHDHKARRCSSATQIGYEQGLCFHSCSFQ